MQRLPLHLTTSKEAKIASLCVAVAITLGTCEIHERRLELGGISSSGRNDLVPKAGGQASVC